MAKLNVKKKEIPTQMVGSNIKPLKDDLIKFRDQIITLKGKRQMLNADIKSIMENAESLGIPKKALRAALNYWESSPEQREGYHDGYNLCLESWGMPFGAKQAEMFEENENIEGGDINVE